MELREKVLQGTMQAFNQKGLKFTMDDIARILGISKKTIYQAFPDKEALFLGMVDYLFDRIKESEREVLEDESLSTLEKIRRILGVMPEGSAVYAASRAAGKLVTLDSCASIADAVVRKTGEPYLYPYIEEYVDDIVTVSEDELRKAIKLACLYAKLTLEGAASLALAVVTSGKCALTEQTVLLCSGGNIDGSVLLSCLQG